MTPPTGEGKGMMGDPTPLAVARRDQILDAAAAVFVERGFHPTTIRDVAKRAGVADGTIYNYFENKIALLLGIFERMRAAIVAEGPPPIPPDGDLRTLIKTLLEYPLSALAGDDFALFRIVISEMLVNAELRALYRDRILDPTLLMAEQVLHARLEGVTPGEVRLIVRAVSGMVLGLILERIMGDEELAARWTELPASLADLIVGGLAGEGGNSADSSRGERSRGGPEQC